MPSPSRPKGFALVVAAALVAALTALVAALLGLGLGSAQLENQRNSQAAAQQLAEMGLARALADLRQQTAAAFSPDLDGLLQGDAPSGGNANIPPAAAATVNGVAVAGWGGGTEVIDGQVYRRVAVPGQGAYYVRLDDNQDDGLPGLLGTSRTAGEGAADVAAADRDQSVVVLSRGAAGPDAVSWATAQGRKTLRATVRGSGPRSVIAGGDFTPDNNAVVCGQGAQFCSAAATAGVNCLCGAVRAGTAAVKAALAALPACAAAGCTRCDPVDVTVQACAPAPIPAAPAAADVDPRAADFRDFAAAAGTCLLRLDAPAAGPFAGAATVHLWDNAVDPACATSAAIVAPDFDPATNGNFPADCWAPVFVSDAAWPGVGGGPPGATDNSGGRWSPGFTDGRIHPLDGRAAGLGATPLWSAACSCPGCSATVAVATWQPAAAALTLGGPANPRGVYLSAVPGALAVNLDAAAVASAVLTTGASVTLSRPNTTLAHPLSTPASPLEPLVAGGGGSCTLADPGIRLEHGMRCGGDANLLNPNDVLAGNVTVAGAFNANVDGLQVFLVSVPALAQVWVGGGAVLRNNASLYANVQVRGDLALGSNAAVTGTLWSGGNLDPAAGLRVDPPATMDSLAGSVTVLGAVQSLPQ